MLLEPNSQELPGTIVYDFEVFICFVAENYLNITGNKGFLPNSCLPILNLRLSHPIKVQLKRDQQLSYPHINALYLLCRTLGILQIAKDKSKRYLNIDKSMLEKWHLLTASEKYFNLLQTFTYTDRCGILQCVNHPYSEDSPYTDELKVGEIDILSGDIIKFLFDFGDMWKFNVQLETIQTTLKPHRPTIIEKCGKAPEQYEYHE